MLYYLLPFAIFGLMQNCITTEFLNTCFISYAHFLKLIVSRLTDTHLNKKKTFPLLNFYYICTMNLPEPFLMLNNFETLLETLCGTTDRQTWGHIELLSQLKINEREKYNKSNGLLFSWRSYVLLLSHVVYTEGFQFICQQMLWLHMMIKWFRFGFSLSPPIGW